MLFLLARRFAPLTAYRSPYYFPAPMANYQYIFTMRDLRKVGPPSREILKGNYLSSFPGPRTALRTVSSLYPSGISTAVTLSEQRAGSRQ